jgi:tousled-like kinase
LIQKNILKRPRSPDDDQSLTPGNEAAKILDGMDPRPSLDNTNRKKQARGRGRAGTGRGRGSKTVDQIRSTSASSVVTTNGQLDKLTNNVCQLFVIMVSI